MYRLVIHLPFKILLVHRQGFYLQDAANHYQKEHYGLFPGIAVWTQREIDEFRGRTLPFPYGAHA
jgi:hypothetical protein